MVGITQSKKVMEITGIKPKEKAYGHLTYLDFIAQADTDSVAGDSIININSKNIKIEDFFNNAEGSVETRGKNNLIKHIEDKYVTNSLNVQTQKIENKKIKYVMAHKVKKRMFKIKTKNNEVIITEDHSIIIERKGKILSIKPKDIIETDRIIKISNISNLLTFVNNFQIEDLGIQEQWVYDIEVEDNHNFFANNICVHNSNYTSIEEVVIKKFGKNYEKTTPKERITEFVLNYIEKVAMPITRDVLDNIYAYTMNAMMPEKLTEDPEIVCDNFISIAPKMYFGRKLWDEGVTLAKPKLKITGLSTIRATTPKYFRKELSNVMNILIDNDIPNVQKYISRVKEETLNKEPSEICFNQGVSSIDYEWDEGVKKFRRWDGTKYLGAPINSRAALIHNKYIEKNKLNIPAIESGDKIKFLYMKIPNNLFNFSNVFGFKNDKVFDTELKSYIDYNEMFQKGFLQGIKLITDPLGWEIEKEESIDLDEW